ncbi:MAG: EutN/CcmL family microcompartment protein [Caldisericota bacterium]|jgi:ethanolamine utilization protein EutN|nr:EutN/CcmL family microcompartment protein [Caldisericota bacterium]
MIIARVIGSAVSTAKTERLKARKLLVVQEATVRNELREDAAPFVAVDAAGAGEGELVLVAVGSGGRFTELTDQAPADATIVGILDSLVVDGQYTFQKS